MQNSNPLAADLAHSTAARKTATHAVKISATLANFDLLPASAYVDIDVVVGVLSCGKSTVWAWVKSQRLPEPRKFGRSTRWQVGDLRRVLSGEIA